MNYLNPTGQQPVSSDIEYQIRPTRTNNSIKNNSITCWKSNENVEELVPNPKKTIGPLINLPETVNINKEEMQTDSALPSINRRNDKSQDTKETHACKRRRTSTKEMALSIGCDPFNSWINFLHGSTFYCDYFSQRVVTSKKCIQLDIKC